MDRAAFAAHAAAFAARTAAARDGWRWNAVAVGRAAGREGEGYLSKEDNSVDVDVGDEKQQHDDDDEKRHDDDEEKGEGEKGHDDEEKGHDDDDEKGHDDEEKGHEGEKEHEGEEYEEEARNGTELEEEQHGKRMQRENGQHRGERGVQPRTQEHASAAAVDMELLEDDASDIATLVPAHPPAPADTHPRSHRPCRHRPCSCEAHPTPRLFPAAEVTKGGRRAAAEHDLPRAVESGVRRAGHVPLLHARQYAALLPRILASSTSNAVACAQQ